MRINAVNNVFNFTNNKTKRQEQQKRLNFKGADAFNYSRQMLDRAVLGFEEQKNKIVTSFFEPFIEAFKNPTIQTPPAILLYGIDLGVIKKIVNGITFGLNNLGMNTCFSLNSKVPSNDFIQTISNGLNNFLDGAKNNAKFAIFIEESEKYIGMSESQATKLVDFEFDAEDKEILAANNNSDNIGFLKSLLDNCSKHPSERGYGTTLIFSTDKPHLIHPDLRRGKVEKIEIGRISDKEVGITLLNIVEQVRLQFQQEIMKSCGGNPAMLARLETLNPINNKFFINQLFNLSVTNNKGAFTEEDLYNIVTESFINTLDDPLNTTGNIYLGFNLGMWQRSISAEKVAKMDSISNLFNRTPFQKLVTKEECGSITKEETVILNNMREARSIDKLILAARQTKEKLTPYEERYLKELMKD